MKIIIAPDSFKGSCTSLEAAVWLEDAVRRVAPDAVTVKMPIADGGEGTLDAVAACVAGRLVRAGVFDPIGRRREARYLLTDDGVAVIEMAEASGLTLLSAEERDPRVTTTYGTGELIRDALDRGVRRFLIAIGGSATNDGGAGALSALGARFLDRDGAPLPAGGAALAELFKIDLSALDPRIAESSFTVASDVTNPLTGEQGASKIYGKQKGADEETVALLDRALSRFATVAHETLGQDLSNAPGAGAAGGLGFALRAFLGARFSSGIETVLDLARFDEHLADADLVLTGEGRIDGQSVYGKVLYGIGTHCKRAGVPAVAFGGGVLPDSRALYDHGITALFSIANAPMPLEAAMRNAEPLLKQAAENALRLFLANKR